MSLSKPHNAVRANDNGVSPEELNMSLTVAPGDLLAVRFTFTNVATATAMNVLHYRLGSISGTIPNMTTFLGNVAAAANAGYQSVWKPAANSHVSFVATRAWSVFPLPRSVGVEVVHSPATPGDILGDALPLQDTATILKRTEVGDRSGLGRFFFVGLSEDEQANGVISLDQRLMLDAVALWLGGPLSVTGVGYSAILNPCIVKGPEDNPVRITNVLSCAVSNNIIKTQRRRRPGKGI